MFLCRAVLGAGSGAWGLVELAATGRWSYFHQVTSRVSRYPRFGISFFDGTLCDFTTSLQDGSYRHRMGRRASMADKVFGRRGDPRRVDAVQSFVSFLVLEPFTSEVFEHIKFNFFVYHSVFRGGKREFSSIAGLDSPYHSLQVAAVTRFLFHRFIGQFWSFWQGDLDVLYSFLSGRIWPLLEELGFFWHNFIFLGRLWSLSQKASLEWFSLTARAIPNLVTGWGWRTSSSASWVYFNTQCCSGVTDLRSSVCSVATVIQG